MNSNDYWKIFVETGAPEMYLLFNRARRMEDGYVPENTGACAESVGLQ